jgi:hypothetical protein
MSPGRRLACRTTTCSTTHGGVVNRARQRSARHPRLPGNRFRGEHVSTHRKFQLRDPSIRWCAGKRAPPPGAPVRPDLHPANIWRRRSENFKRQLSYAQNVFVFICAHAILSLRSGSNDNVRFLTYPLPTPLLHHCFFCT